MSTHGRHGYRYVGPEELRAAVRPGTAGRAVRSAADLDAWVAERGAEELAEPFTFVVDAEGTLRLGARRSEHVACAGGGRVLSAGEIGFTGAPGRWVAAEVSNQSTGYCPDPGSWPAVAGALERAGLTAPPGFTHEVVFRRCEECGERGIVRDGDFSCVFCGGALPATWNVDPRPWPDGA
ncbi:hypothetical protein [Marinitenerispora sediminis]|uniref:Uncharacterized protein n=1 Tax=Marinitenerispora sediminis TaxID=1931232 RepID=A0A368SZ14_9ACTN|nr:hypothetical protein [Marinitenerispora sediminis]RCV48506.1 hypothetical protein DEF23_24950 [Marinitenerispora sediminis]RCV50375.1 hypothetical protein DEF24_24290 [Marinitenerispora sediminis]RCV57421.1 hypothetical protein DEF28_01535 [Marinitenerispora sediminis]